VLLSIFSWIDFDLNATFSKTPCSVEGSALWQFVQTCGIVGFAAGVAGAPAGRAIHLRDGGPVAVTQASSPPRPTLCDQSHAARPGATPD
jgi:hypothetical protein